MRLLLFSLLSLSIALTSCGSNADSITNLPEKTEADVEFNLETFEFEDLSPEMQEQISEVGCDYSFKKDGKPFMINGLVKINGIFERLQEVQMND